MCKSMNTHPRDGTGRDGAAAETGMGTIMEGDRSGDGNRNDNGGGEEESSEIRGMSMPRASG